MIGQGVVLVAVTCSLLFLSIGLVIGFIAGRATR